MSVARQQSIIVAGFGGQGIMLLGRLIAYSGMKKNYEVSWIPSYGPEMRGGTANCTVIMSEEPIGSPVVEDPDIIMVFNRPSIEKFQTMLKEGGKCFYDSSLIPEFDGKRDDVEYIPIPATGEAAKMGNTKVANLVMGGAYLERTDFIDLDTVMKALADTLPKRRHNLLPLNEKALNLGMELAK